MAKIVLLGGSNSIVRSSVFPAGTKEEVDSLAAASSALSLALGASTSAQNLCQVVRYGAQFEQYDFVISESNVNDIYAHNRAELSLEQTLNQIDLYYEALACYAKRVLVLILSTRGEPVFKNVEIINQQHLDNCRRYGFAVVNMYATYKKYQDELPIFHDDEHPNKLLMLNLWKSLFHLNPLELKAHVKPRFLSHDYQFLDAEELSEGTLEVQQKKNSLFAESYLQVTTPVGFSKGYWGYDLAGIATWNEGYSQLQLSNANQRIVKAFNGLNSFNEFRQALTIDSTTLIEQVDSSEQQTERSMLVDPEVEASNSTNLVGLLVKKKRQEPDGQLVSDGAISLNYLLPEIDQVLRIIKAGNPNFNLQKAAKKLLQLEDYEPAIRLVDGIKSEDITNHFRDCAVRIEQTNLKAAYQLMSAALARRPEGLFIQKKVKEYEQALKIENGVVS